MVRRDGLLRLRVNVYSWQSVIYETPHPIAYSHAEIAETMRDQSLDLVTPLPSACRHDCESRRWPGECFIKKDRVWVGP